MLKTEEEAKKLWCPFAFTLGTLRQPAQPGGPDYVVGAGGQNRGYEMGSALNSCRCIASQCMAWRWSDHPERETRRLYKGETEVDDEPITRAGNWRVISGEKWLYEYSDVDQKGEFELVHRAAPEDAPKRGWCGLAGKPNQ